ncbi:TetR/AcrR family transcriptional regulator C-terminal domain-containing protein [Actinomadura scrupuli]|uniref:TetR/AcrR family transcriptional regulator C-terminal domain-containing protein n=1 Tax=Actinomadura scrupuli TaxID=559629 RepID=UPI003D98C665
MEGSSPADAAPGADGHGPVWTRPKNTGRRPALTREAIVAAAIELADAEGLAAVSIRRVAARLDARAMSLYTHIDRKDDLLELIRDEVAGELLLEGELPGRWREALTLIARRTRESALRHPWMVDLHAVGGAPGPNALRHVDQSMAALSGLGLNAVVAWRILSAVDHYTLGCVIQEIMQLRRGDQSELLGPYLENVAASGDYPHLEPILKNGLPDEQDFERGLGWLLDGIERDLGGE